MHTVGKFMLNLTHFTVHPQIFLLIQHKTNIKKVKLESNINIINIIKN